MIDITQIRNRGGGCMNRYRIRRQEEWAEYTIETILFGT
jgi:hypothetical protein